MKTVHEAIIFGIKSSKEMLDAMTADLKSSEWDHRAVPKSNCAAWLVGHLILVDRHALKHAGVTELPELPAGFETTFGREADAPHAATFGDATPLMPMFDRHREMLMAALAKLPESKFDEPLPKPNARFKTYGEFFAFMAFHVLVHCGQISTIRRSLGRPPLF
jgi:hypothetical protein